MANFPQLRASALYLVVPPERMSDFPPNRTSRLASSRARPYRRHLPWSATRADVAFSTDPTFVIFEETEPHLVRNPARGFGPGEPVRREFSHAQGFIQRSSNVRTDHPLSRAQAKQLVLRCVQPSRLLFVEGSSLTSAPRVVESLLRDFSENQGRAHGRDARNARSAHSTFRRIGLASAAHGSASLHSVV